VVEAALGSIVMVPVGVAIVALCEEQKYGTTAPLGAFAGIMKVAVPRKIPVSNVTPLAEPGVNWPGLDSLVTE
jgi:hypothetical protein